ncbi:MAG TPA: FKBP-type peptidyl-prolyl cis-trans isomerase [Solirubrobacterales bacterium]|jgi:peptidylprolyl isomerase|nr:FKBP-type peptidyl-prolyl cis-trans isomerase [Solirubrobacterales bacterium]
MKLPALMLALCLALAIAVAGCGGSSDSSSGSSGSSSAEPDNTDLSKKPIVVVPKGVSPKTFAYKEIVEGTGPVAKSGDKVTVQYVGVGFDTEKEFDSSWSRNEPFPFTLGAGEVIKGWDKGVEGMKVGGRRELLLPGDLAYGPAGNPPKIGPNETLIFIIDLLKVE